MLTLMGKLNIKLAHVRLLIFLAIRGFERLMRLAITVYPSRMRIACCVLREQAVASRKELGKGVTEFDVCLFC